MLSVLASGLLGARLGVNGYPTVVARDVRGRTTARRDNVIALILLGILLVSAFVVVGPATTPIPPSPIGLTLVAATSPDTVHPESGGGVTTPDWNLVCDTGSGATHCTPQPPSRYGASIVYDAADDYIFLFGGATTNASGFQNDSWDYVTGGSPSPWTALTTPVAPPKMSNYSMVFDGTDGYVLLFGGYGSSNTYFNQTWSYLGGVWTKVVTNTGLQKLVPRAGACMVWVPPTGLSGGYDLLFGGKALGTGAGAWLSDTWKYSAGVWTNITSTAGTPPSGRAGSACAWDATDSQVILFGGLTNTGLVNDTWAFISTLNGGVGGWTSLGLSVAPSPRFKASIANWSTGNEIVLYGGFYGNYNGEIINPQDTWVFLYGAWVNVTATAVYGSTPKPKGGAAMSDYPDANSVIWFAGRGSNSLSNSTYSISTVFTVSISRNLGEIVLGQTVKFYVNVTAGGSGNYIYSWKVPPGCNAALNLSVNTCTPNAAGNYNNQIRANVTDWVSGNRVQSKLSKLIVDPSSSQFGTLTTGPVEDTVSSSFWALSLNGNQNVANSTLANLLNQTPSRVFRFQGFGDTTNVSENCVFSNSGACGGTSQANFSQFVTLCRWLSCQSILPLPAETNRPGDAVATVKYVETVLGFHPTYWSIGNEPGGWSHFNIPWTSWHSTDAVAPTAQQFGIDAANVSAAVLAYDPTVKLIGVQASHAGGGIGPLWGNTSKYAGKNVTTLAYHEYPQGHPQFITYYDFLAPTATNLLTKRLKLGIQNVSTYCVSCNPKPSTAIDEFNSQSISGSYNAYQQGYLNVPFITANIVEALALGVSRFEYYNFQGQPPLSMYNLTTRSPYPIYYTYADLLRYMPMGTVTNVSIGAPMKGLYSVESTVGSQTGILIVNVNTSVALTLSTSGALPYNYLTTYIDSFPGAPANIVTTTYGVSLPSTITVPAMGVALLVSSYLPLVGPPGVQPPPTNLSVTATTSTSVTLSWINPTLPFVLPITSVVVYYGPACSLSASVQISGAVSGYTVTGLSPSTGYCFAVADAGQIGASAKTSVVFATTSAPPPGILTLLINDVVNQSPPQFFVNLILFLGLVLFAVALVSKKAAVGAIAVVLIVISIVGIAVTGAPF